MKIGQAIVSRACRTQRGALTIRNAPIFGITENSDGVTSQTPSCACRRCPSACTVYIRRVDKVGNETRNLEFDKIENVKDPFKAHMPSNLAAKLGRPATRFKPLEKNHLARFRDEKFGRIGCEEC
jgi:hypothetical protein